MLLNNRHGSVDSDAYRYGFQGQERDDEVKGEGNSYNYKYRMQDVRLGRFFAVDPLIAKYPDYTSYSFSGNRVIDAIEFEGLEEFKIHSASFAPFDVFAQPIIIPGFRGMSKTPPPPIIIGPFNGDGNNREFGVDPYASSRIYGNVGIDFTSSGMTINADPIGRGSISKDQGTLQTESYSEATFKAEIRSSNVLTFHLSGSNSAFPAPSFLVPDIDVQSGMMISREENDKGSTISFNGFTFGDAFPANETFITDKCGIGVFLGVSGADELGPEIMLVGNNERHMAFFDLKINFDLEGNIISVDSNGKNYSVNDWNNQFKTQDEKKGGSTDTKDFDEKR